MEQIKNDVELLAEISIKQKKIQKLEKILNSRIIEKIQIIFIADGRLNDINQSDTPFSLPSEIRLLLKETIEQYEIDIENLKLQF